MHHGPPMHKQQCNSAVQQEKELVAVVKLRCATSDEDEGEDAKTQMNRSDPSLCESCDPRLE